MNIWIICRHTYVVWLCVLKKSKGAVKCIHKRELLQKTVISDWGANKKIDAYTHTCINKIVL